MKPATFAAIQAQPCPYCKADPNLTCRDFSGYPRTFHVERMEAADQVSPLFPKAEVIKLHGQ